MEQVTRKSKQISYRPQPEVREFLDIHAAKTYRSTQGMIDYLMNRIIEMEKKGEIEIQ